MDCQGEPTIRQSIRTINHELGEVWQAVAGIKTDMEWVKWFLQHCMIPAIASMVLLLLGILLKLLLA